MRIVYTATALADLEDVYAYQRAYWPTFGGKFEARLSAVERRLLGHPRSGPEVSERPGVRVISMIDLPYRVFYAIAEADIVILHIRHVARRPWV
ncbi:MAG TPA: type II toxin-antitoxin system RelE/ParE family toxin [Rhodoblastus sp.]|nr:type II toxin-antitoxin system RelE/ParE family toxin [Rhodoblastus sp.]